MQGPALQGRRVPVSVSCLCVIRRASLKEESSGNFPMPNFLVLMERTVLRERHCLVACFTFPSTHDKPGQRCPADAKVFASHVACKPSCRCVPSGEQSERRPRYAST
ncbi:hypothetical protein TREES_T100015894 [Tupaia chinensis]|uniref:Uncharacterized protein n=1 Tax=Tupaia chinensis TaxID=246437 RepID=L9KWQ9_TUPCH|nr:hypothetical protein TREES_T100015894 [Tupaia chinensis]